MALIFDSLGADFFAALTVLIGVIYWHYSRAFKYWEKKGLASVKPSFPAGNVGSITTVSEPFGQVFKKLYDALKRSGPVAGFYIFTRPCLLITDPEMVKTVLVRDFNYFHDHGLYSNEKLDPLSAHLFSLEGIKWKKLRIKMSPTFSTGKMKILFPLMQEVGDEFTNFLQDAVTINSEMEIKDPLVRFTTDVIGTCAFGIKCNSIQNPNSEFRTKSKLHFEPNRFKAVKDAFIIMFKDLATMFNMRFVDKTFSDFFIGAVRETVEYREKNNVSRNDFMQLMMEMKNKEGLGTEESLTVNEIAAQAFVFFLGGSETSANTMSFAIYELALNQEIQQKARKEIYSILENETNGGPINYEALQGMEYLGMIINETLRKYSLVPALNREVAKDYTLPGTDTIIPAGMTVIIPVHGFHHDPEYNPDPDRFDPDRFTEENKNRRHPFAFLPFGEGPRICLGLRFGILQTRLALCILLSKYKIELSQKTPVPLNKFNPKVFVTQAIDGIWVKLIPIN